VLPPSSSDTSTSLGPLMVPQPFTYSTCTQHDTSVYVLLLCQYVIWQLVMLQMVRRHSGAATVKQRHLNLIGSLSMVPQPFTY
jgi:ligand-binding sensor domain-containing protein